MKVETEQMIRSMAKMDGEVNPNDLERAQEGAGRIAGELPAFSGDESEKMKNEQYAVALRAGTRKRATRRNRLTPIETRQFALGLKFAHLLSCAELWGFIDGELRPSKSPRFPLRVFSATPDTKPSRNFTKMQCGSVPCENWQGVLSAGTDSLNQQLILSFRSGFAVEDYIPRLQTRFADWRGLEPCCIFVLFGGLFVSRHLAENRRLKRRAATPRTTRYE